MHEGSSNETLRPFTPEKIERQKTSTVHKISSTNKQQSQSNDNVIKPLPSSKTHKISSTNKQQSQSNDNVIKPLPSSTVHKISSTNKHQSQSNDNVIKPVPSFDFVPSPSSKDLSNRKDVGARVCVVIFDYNALFLF